jgi:hypothetical protein
LFSKDGDSTVVFVVVIIIGITQIDANVWCLNNRVVVMDG